MGKKRSKQAKAGPMAPGGWADRMAKLVGTIIADRWFEEQRKKAAQKYHDSLKKG